MMLKALLLSADEKTQRVVRRVLSDLEINLDACTDAESAINRLTRWRFEAVVLDFGDARSARQVLRAARLAPTNKRAIMVALMDANSVPSEAFKDGAHFALQKTQSFERVKSNFRAVRALMKQERRRNLRVPIDLKVVCEFDDQRLNCYSSDLGEGGMALRVLKGQQFPMALTISFMLPSSEDRLKLEGEVAWRSVDGLAGIRFVDAPREVKQSLKQWVASASGEELLDEDAPIKCELTDLSPAACYLATTAPFPRRTRVSLRMGVVQHNLRAEGMVRVAHPEKGMGVEFLLETPAQRADVEALIQTLCTNPAERPEFLVEPEEMDAQPPSFAPAPRDDDPLQALFIQHADAPAEVFQAELLKQRRSKSSGEDEVDILSV